MGVNEYDHGDVPTSSVGSSSSPAAPGQGEAPIAADPIPARPPALRMTCAEALANIRRALAAYADDVYAEGASPPNLTRELNVLSAMIYLRKQMSWTWEDRSRGAGTFTCDSNFCEALIALQNAEDFE